MSSVPFFLPAATNSVSVLWTRSIGNFDPGRPANANGYVLSVYLGPRYQRKSVYKLTEAYIRAPCNARNRPPASNPLPARINSVSAEFTLFYGYVAPPIRLFKRVLIFPSLAEMVGTGILVGDNFEFRTRSGTRLNSWILSRKEKSQMTLYNGENYKTFCKITGTGWFSEKLKGLRKCLYLWAGKWW